MILGGHAHFRQQMKELLFEIDGVDVVDVSTTTDSTIKKVAKYIPDLIFLDIDASPDKDIDILQSIKKDYPHIGVVLMGGAALLPASRSQEFRRNGAFSCIIKPEKGDIDSITKFLREDVYPIIKHFFWKKYGSRAGRTEKPTKSDTIPSKSDSLNFVKHVQRHKETPNTIPYRFDVIAVGISTGGPPALQRFITALPSDLDLPILVVQHMPAMFTKTLANSLNDKSKLTVVEATHDELVEKNKVYIAPGALHMVVQKQNGQYRIAITDTPPVNACKPSVDVLFDSVTESYRENVLAIIMTGMGSDGLKGVQRMMDIPCYVVTQSQVSCIVYGMPAMVDRAGLSNESVHLDALAERVTHIIKNGVR